MSESTVKAQQCLRSFVDGNYDESLSLIDQVEVIGYVGIFFDTCSCINVSYVLGYVGISSDTWTFICVLSPSNPLS